MVAKGSKRAASVAPPAKDAKKPRIDARISNIVEVLEKAEQPESCRAMMVALAHSLLIPTDGRHELQSVGVAIVEETLQEAKSKLVESISVSEGRLSELESSKAELKGRVEQAKSAAMASADAKKAAQEALTEAASGVDVAKKLVMEKEASRDHLEKELAVATEEKTTTEALVEEHMRAPLAAGDGPHYFFLKNLVTKLGLEESFSNALPSSCIKSKEQRGKFDELVLAEFEKALDRHLLALAAAATSAAAVVPAAAESAGAAAAQLREAEAAAGAAEQALEAAQEQDSLAARGLHEARIACEDVGPAIFDVTSELKRLKLELADLEHGPLASFAELRDKVAVSPPEGAAPAGA